MVILTIFSNTLSLTIHLAYVVLQCGIILFDNIYGNTFVLSDTIFSLFTLLINNITSYTVVLGDGKGWARSKRQSLGPISIPLPAGKARTRREHPTLVLALNTQIKRSTIGLTACLSLCFNLLQDPSTALLFLKF